MNEDQVIELHQKWLEQGGSQATQLVKWQNLRSLIKRALDIAWEEGYKADRSDKAVNDKARGLVAEARSSFREGAPLVPARQIAPPIIPEIKIDRNPDLDPKPAPLVDSNPQPNPEN